MPALRSADQIHAILPELSPGRPLPPLSRLAVALARTVVAWEGRHRARRGLARLDPHMLRDIGISVQEASDEISKPFWRG